METNSLKKTAFTFCMLFFFIEICFGQKNIRFEHFTIEDGLINNSLNHIMQDSKGYIWISTTNGISRFDGYSFLNFRANPTDSTKLSGQNVRKIIEDENHTLWLATNNGLNRYSGKSQCFKSYIYDDNNPRSINDNSINDILIDKDGDFWLCTFKGGLNKFNRETGEFTHFTHNENDSLSLINNCLQQIFEDSKNRLWLLSSYGDLQLFNKEKKTFHLYYRTKTENNEHHDYSIEEDRFGNLWIGNSSDAIGYWIFNPDTKEVTCFNADDEVNSLSSNDIRHILHDSKGLWWFATNALGINIYNPDTDTYRYSQYCETSNECLSTNIVNYIFEDSLHSIWVGTRAGGLNVWHRDRYKFRLLQKDLNNSNSICYNNVSSVYEDSRGYLWIGTDGGGLSRYDPENNQYEHFSSNKKGKYKLLQSNKVLSITEDKNGNLYFGEWAGGFTRYHPETGAVKVFRHSEYNPQTISSDNVWSVFIDSQNFLWIATIGGGLNRMDLQTETIKKFKYNALDKNSISDNFVNRIYEDSKNQIWIGTAGNGLNLFDRKKENFTRFLYKEANPQSLSSNLIWSIVEDSKGRLWIGTGNGLNLMQTPEGAFTKYTVKDGLPGNEAAGMIEDDSGNLWIATNRGLSRFSPDKKEFRNYTTKDGLQDMQFSFGLPCKKKNGELVFFGINGVNIFHPDSIKNNPYPPKLAFTGLRLFNIPVSVGDTINGQVVLPKAIDEIKQLTLNHRNNFFILEFAALHFLAPKQNQYKYKLEGFDKHWIYTESDRRLASYTNLSQGDYIFKMTASNNDGLWNQDGISLKIIILPPWWKTLWFRIILIIIIIGSAIGFYLYRVKALKRQKKLLEKTVRERTKELQEAHVELEEKFEEIIQQKEHIDDQRKKLEKQRDELSIRNEEIKTQRNKISKAYNNMQIISEFGQKITATLNIEAINNMILKYISSLMDADAFGIGLYNKKNKLIEYPAFIENGIKMPFFHKTLDRKNSLTVWCFTNQKTVFINNIENEYDKYINQPPKVSTSQRPYSIIHIPLTVKDKKIGILAINSFKKNAYAQEDVTNLQSLASYIAIALDNSQAYKLVNRQNEHITSSINYGKTIQQAILPMKTNLDKVFENFILFLPKDIVSGDFYWYAKVNIEKHKSAHFIAVVDCTGHGVPGAFMSMIGKSLLDEIILVRKIHKPVTILEELDKGIQTRLKQSQTNNQDGMDICLIKLEKAKETAKNDTEKQEFLLTFAGAKRPLFYYQSNTNKLHEIKGTRRSIGRTNTQFNQFFSSNELIVNNEDVLYLSSDGFVDQSGTERRRFGTPRLLKTLTGIAQKPLEEQKQLLLQTYEVYKQNQEQRDDITILGLKIKQNAI